MKLLDSSYLVSIDTYACSASLQRKKLECTGIFNGVSYDERIT